MSKTELLSEGSSDEDEIPINLNAEISKSKHGDDNPTTVSESESSSEDEVDPDNPELDMEFFRVLAAIRTNHPILEKEELLKTSSKSAARKSKKKEKENEKPFTVEEYERKVILEEGGMYEDDREIQRPDVDSDELLSKKEKFSFEDNLSDNDDDEDSLFTKKDPVPEEKCKTTETETENAAVEFLKGNRKSLDNKVDEELLTNLKDDWNTQMSNKEKYLMDYFVNKRYLEDDDETIKRPSNHYILDIEPLEKDEETFEKMEEYETKYRFRFEEPDQEFIRRYPRLVRDSVRQKDNKRKKVRERKKQKKTEDQTRRVQEVRKLKACKKKEILERIKKLEESAGKKSEFENINFDDDFDPMEHDKMMSNLFDKNYYNEDESNEKPVFEDEALNLELEEQYEKLNQIETITEGDYKYKEVTPNSYGLSTEEVLCANANELNRWYPLKGIMLHDKTREQELREQEHFMSEGANDFKKIKILPSLFVKNVEELLEEEEDKKRKKNLKKKERKLKKLKALENPEQEKEIGKIQKITEKNKANSISNMESEEGTADFIHNHGECSEETVNDQTLHKSNKKKSKRVGGKPTEHFENQMEEDSEASEQPVVNCDQNIKKDSKKKKLKRKGKKGDTAGDRTPTLQCEANLEIEKKKTVKDVNADSHSQGQVDELYTEEKESLKSVSSKKRKRTPEKYQEQKNRKSSSKKNNKDTKFRSKWEGRLMAYGQNPASVESLIKFKKHGL